MIHLVAGDVQYSGCLCPDCRGPLAKMDIYSISDGDDAIVWAGSMSGCEGCRSGMFNADGDA